MFFSSSNYGLWFESHVHPSAAALGYLHLSPLCGRRKLTATKAQRATIPMLPSLTVGLLILLLTAFTVKAQEASADNWPQFRGNPSLTGVSQANVPNDLKLLWTYEAGES